jgi:hypothetical protein
MLPTLPRAELRGPHAAPESGAGDEVIMSIAGHVGDSAEGEH